MPYLLYTLFLFLRMEGHTDFKGIQLLDPTLGKNIITVKAEFLFMVFVFPPPLQMLLQVGVWNKCLLVG